MLIAMTPSVKNWRWMSRCLAPVAMRIPISRVRSLTLDYDPAELAEEQAYLEPERD
jgi:hypothetical protein